MKLVLYACGQKRRKIGKTDKLLVMKLVCLMQDIIYFGETELC